MIKFCNNIYSELVNSKYMKDILVLTSGVGVSQLIPLLLLPILTRFFSPTDFGVLAVYMAIVQLLAISLTLRLEMAVILPKKDTDAAILCFRAFCSLFIISAFISFLSFFFIKYLIANPSTIVYELIEKQYDTMSIGAIQFILNNPIIIYLIPIGSLFLGLYNILYSWNNRMGLYKNMSYSHITHSIFSTPVSVLFYFSSFKSFALILGQIIGRCFACFLLLQNLLKTIFLIPSNTLMTQSSALVKKYRKFIIYETPHAILNFFSQKIIIAVFTVFFGFFTVGVFDLADKIIGKPLGIISNSFKTVFYKRLTTAKEKLNIFKKSILLMTLISCVLIAPFYIIPENFFIVLLGPEWHDTGKYIKLLCPLLLSRFIFNVVSPSISYTLQNHYLLIWQIIYFILLVCLFYCIYTLTVEDVLLAYALLGSFMYIVLGYVSFLVLKNHIKY